MCEIKPPENGNSPTSFFLIWMETLYDFCVAWPGKTSTMLDRSVGTGHPHTLSALQESIQLLTIKDGVSSIDFLKLD